MAGNAQRGYCHRQSSSFPADSLYHSPLPPPPTQRGTSSTHPKLWLQLLPLQLLLLPLQLLLLPLWFENLFARPDKQRWRPPPPSPPCLWWPCSPVAGPHKALWSCPTARAEAPPGQSTAAFRCVAVEWWRGEPRATSSALRPLATKLFPPRLSAPRRGCWLHSSQC